jgi:hypothetical protein
LGNAGDAKLVLAAIVYFKVARQESFTLFPVGLVKTSAQHSGSFHKKAWEECNKGACERLCHRKHLTCKLWGNKNPCKTLKCCCILGLKQLELLF